MTARLLLLVLPLLALAAAGCRPRPAAPPPPADAPGDPTPLAGKPAPEFAGVTAWVNSQPLTLAGLRGKVVVVHFWTNGCINCIHNYPHYRAWQDRYKADPNLVIVGVHTPEFEAEKDVARIKERAAMNGLAFAVAVDNDRATWEAWGVEAWPSVFLVDKKGAIRHLWEGELHESGYGTVTGWIDALRRE